MCPFPTFVAQLQKEQYTTEEPNMWGITGQSILHIRDMLASCQICSEMRDRVCAVLGYKIVKVPHAGDLLGNTLDYCHNFLGCTLEIMITVLDLLNKSLLMVLLLLH